MHQRHFDKQRYFQEQEATAKKYILPFIGEEIEISENTSVLEIGCGIGGNLKPFLELGCKRVVGVDFSESSIKAARDFFSEHPNRENIQFICSDIYDIQELGTFDVIITKDVLEHIHGQEKFMRFVKKFLKPQGKFFLGFPPWHNPFGGHQQMCQSKILSKLPFFHILPSAAYRFILKQFGESEGKIEALLEVKETGITIEQFEKIVRKTGYKKDRCQYYFINPNYEIKFGLKPRKQLKFISMIPYFRNLVITTNYYLVSLKETV